MNRETITTTINIDTLFRNNYDNTNPTNYLQELPEPIQNVISMKLVSSEIPNMWYAFSKENKSNQFIIEIYNYIVSYPAISQLTAVLDSSGNHTVSDEGYNVYYETNGNPQKIYKVDVYNTIYTDITHNIIVPQGNYLSTNLVDTINNIFLNTKNGLDNLVFDIDEVTGHSYFRTREITDEPHTQPSPFFDAGMYYSPFFSYKIIFEIPDEPNRYKYENMGWNLGYNNKVYEANINTIPRLEYSLSRHDKQIIAYKGFIESESTYGRAAMQYIFLEINDFNNVDKNSDKIISKSNDNKYLSTKILARIPVTDGSYTTLYNDNSDFINKIRNYATPVTIKKLHIRILDKFGNVLNLNSNDLSLLLEFTSKI